MRTPTGEHRDREGRNEVYFGASGHGFDSSEIFLKISRGGVRSLDKPASNTEPAQSKLGYYTSCSYQRNIFDTPSCERATYYRGCSTPSLCLRGYEI